MSHEAIVVFTAKSVERILQEGGTSSWRLDRNHARLCEYALCTRNAHADWVEGTEDHHSGFLIGKISDVVPSTEDPDRYLVRFRAFARVAIPSAWKGDRNPVRYGSLSEFGIDPETLNFEPMPEPTGTAPPAKIDLRDQGEGSIRPMTMAEAKKGLALTFGVGPEAIEITIRG